MLANKKYYRTSHKLSEEDKQLLFSKNLGDRLQKARKSNKLTQKTVAEKLGTSQKRISDIEAGNCKHSAFDLLQFSKIYQKPISYFYMSDF